jgi:thiol-disulfide isomerase/thioredoxin
MGERLTLYGRSYCHLCDDMVKALEGLRDSLGFSLHVADVDEDPDLEAAYGELVPVLVDAQGREICHYFLDIDALHARLRVK